MNTMSQTSSKSMMIVCPDVLPSLRDAYQRDGRLAAAATYRQKNPAISMSEALFAVDRVLGLRKPSAIM